jgi:hypothetical protein
MIAYDEVIDGVVWTIVLDERGEELYRTKKNEAVARHAVLQEPAHALPTDGGLARSVAG